MRFNSGFVPVPRHWWDHLETAPAAWSKVWIYVALNANIRPANFQGRVIQRGQLVRSVASLARECGVTSRQTRGALEGMREANVASIETTNKYSVITLLEFDVYGSSTESECQTEWKTKCQTPRQTDDKRDGNNLKNKQVKVDSNNKILAIYLKTTIGRIIFNNIIGKSLEK